MVLNNREFTFNITNEHFNIGLVNQFKYLVIIIDNQLNSKNHTATNCISTKLTIWLYDYNIQKNC